VKEMLDIPSISAIVVATGVIVGIVFTILEIRNLVKTRQTDLVLRLYTTFVAKDFQEAYEKTLTMETKNYNDTLKKGYLQGLRTIGGFFEGIGVLLHRKLVDVEVVNDLFSESIKLMWEKTKPVLYDFREQFNLPAYARYFEYLYNETQKREQTLQTHQ